MCFILCLFWTFVVVGTWGFCGQRPQNKHKDSIKFITIMCILTYSNKSIMQMHVCKLGASFTLNWSFIFLVFGDKVIFKTVLLITRSYRYCFEIHWLWMSYFSDLPASCITMRCSNSTSTVTIPLNRGIQDV